MEIAHVDVGHHLVNTVSEASTKAGGGRVWPLQCCESDAPEFSTETLREQSRRAQFAAQKALETSTATDVSQQRARFLHIGSSLVQVFVFGLSAFD